MTELNRRRQYSGTGDGVKVKVEAGMFWYRCKHKHCTRAFSDKEKYLVHKKEDHFTRILKCDLSNSNAKSRKDEQVDEIMTELPKPSTLSSRSSDSGNNLAEDKVSNSQLHVSSEYGRLNDSHIVSATDDDDFTPEVIVLLEKSPEELLPLYLKTKVSSCVPSLDFVPTPTNDNHDHNQSTLETEIDEQGIQDCVQVASGSSDAELDSQGKIRESANEPTNTAMHDANNVPSSPCPIRYHLRSRAVVIPALVTGTTDDKNKENGNCNDLRKVCDESLGSKGDEMELEIKQSESQGNAIENIVVSDSEVIVAHIIRGSNGDDKISFRATFQSLQHQLTTNETTPLKMNEEDKLNAGLLTDSRVSRNGTRTDDNETSPFASVNDGNHTQDNNEDQYAASEAVLTPIPGVISTLITQQTEFSVPSSIIHPLTSTTIPAKEKHTMTCSGEECGNTGFRLHLDLKEHIIEKHTAVRMTMIYKCMLCHLDFLSKEQLMQHVDFHCDPNKN